MALIKRIPRMLLASRGPQICSCISRKSTSSGAVNFPRPEITERWRAVGAAVLTTGDHGAIEVSFGPRGIELGAMRHARRRFWQAPTPPISGDFDVTAL